MSQQQSKRILITNYIPPRKLEVKESDVYPAQPQQSTRRPQLEDEIQAKLLSVGMRARKAVSEGYKFRSNNFPAYEGSMGPLSVVSFSQDPTPAGKYNTEPRQRINKRSRSEFDEDNAEDLGGDTDDESETIVTKEKVAFFVPKNHAITMREQGGFENADFLMPKSSMQ
ncbi:hypothetical protein TRVA0_022S00364 [Trichomonascus vanleenenianus]|uniref:Dif1p n=1 Tax=Trichomonascus vanleenenianus TaxID=2268995 RepID=UPI003ECA8399